MKPPRKLIVPLKDKEVLKHIPQGVARTLNQIWAGVYTDHFIFRVYGHQAYPDSEAAKICEKHSPKADDVYRVLNRLVSKGLVIRTGGQLRDCADLFYRPKTHRKRQIKGRM